MQKDLAPLSWRLKNSTHGISEAHYSSAPAPTRGASGSLAPARGAPGQYTTTHVVPGGLTAAREAPALGPGHLGEGKATP